MEFPEVVSTFLAEAASAMEARSCPDQFVGVISELRNSEHDFPQRIDAAKRPDGTPSLILILESPHVEEFTGRPGPAKGTTGVLIRQHLRQIRGLGGLASHGLILMNAIQHQCSLGYPTECFRDCLFQRAWRAGGDRAFETRLRCYYREGDRIANCCTKGYGKKREHELRVLVQKGINSALPGVTVARRSHPSSWYSARNRNAEWPLSPKQS